MAMKLQSFGLSDPGRAKKENEDAILMAVESGLYVLCDGCGGHAAGKTASKMTCAMTYEAIRANREALAGYVERPTPAKRERVFDAISQGVNAACERVHAAAQADPDKAGMATTVVVLAVLGNDAIVAHAGDSRLYLLRGRRMHQLTEDHTMANRFVKMGLMSREKAEKVPSGSHLLRAVGLKRHVVLDKLHFELMPGDRMLLCSDGLSGYVPREELGQLCLTEPLAHTPHRMVRLANERGGRDNISAIVVEALDAGGQTPGDLPDTLRTLRAVPLFKNLAYAELLRVVGIAETQSYPAGSRIVTEGDETDAIFVSTAGAVEVVKAGQQLAVLPAGSLFGEIGLLAKTPRSADVVATEDLRVVRIPRAELLELMRRDRLMALRVLWGLCEVLSGRLAGAQLDLTLARDTLAQLEAADLPLANGQDA